MLCLQASLLLEGENLREKMADIARKPAVKWHEDSGVKVGFSFY